MKLHLLSISFSRGKCFQDESSAPSQPAEEEKNQGKMEDAPNSGADVLNLEPEATDSVTPPAETENDGTTAKSTPPATQKSCE